MKKLFAVLTAVLLALSLCACNANPALVSESPHEEETSGPQEYFYPLFKEAIFELPQVFTIQTECE